jgi:hypothetical protein
MNTHADLINNAPDSDNKEIPTMNTYTTINDILSVPESILPGSVRVVPGTIYRYVDAEGDLWVLYSTGENEVLFCDMGIYVAISCRTHIGWFNLDSQGCFTIMNRPWSMARQAHGEGLSDMADTCMRLGELV